MNLPVLKHDLKKLRDELHSLRGAVGRVLNDLNDIERKLDHPEPQEAPRSEN